jgi:hypothetical protein
VIFPDLVGVSFADPFVAVVFVISCDGTIEQEKSSGGRRGGWRSGGDGQDVVFVIQKCFDFGYLSIEKEKKDRYTE